MKDFSIYMFNPQPEPPAKDLLHNQGVPTTKSATVRTLGVYVEEVSFGRRG